MKRHGFIRDKLDIKFLILYLMSRTATPIDFFTLTELTLCDDGIDYFDYAECLSELVTTEHLVLEDKRYAITEKGRLNSLHCESSLPYSVRLKCDKNLVAINAVLRRNAQVRAQVEEREEGGCTLHLFLDDDSGNLLTVSLFTATRERAEQMGKRFRTRPELVYKALVEELMDESEKKPKAKEASAFREEEAEAPEVLEAPDAPEGQAALSTEEASFDPEDFG